MNSIVLLSTIGLLFGNQIANAMDKRSSSSQLSDAGITASRFKRFDSSCLFGTQSPPPSRSLRQVKSMKGMGDELKFLDSFEHFYSEPGEQSQLNDRLLTELRSNNLERVRELLQNEFLEDLQGVLSERLGNRDMVALLLQTQKVSVSECDNSPLVIAVEKVLSEISSRFDTRRDSASLCIVELLLENNANPNVRNGQLLLSALRKGHAALVEMLLEHGADPDSYDPITRVSALSIATQRKDHASMTMLLGAGASHLPFTARPPVQIACFNNDLESLSLLFEFGAKIMVRDLIMLLGRSSLKEHKEIISLCIKDKQFDPKQFPELANSLLLSNFDIALRALLSKPWPSEQLYRLTDTFILKGKESIALEYFPNQTIWKAIEMGRFDLVMAGLESGKANINYDFGIFLKTAILKQNQQLALDLIQRGISLEFIGNDMLQISVEKGLTDVVKKLLERGVAPRLPLRLLMKLSDMTGRSFIKLAIYNMKPA